MSFIKARRKTFEAMEKFDRQNNNIELIASENFVSEGDGSSRFCIN